MNKQLLVFENGLKASAMNHFEDKTMAPDPHLCISVTVSLPKGRD
jgi:hypothetical protein